LIPIILVIGFVIIIIAIPDQYA